MKSIENTKVSKIDEKVAKFYANAPVIQKKIARAKLILSQVEHS